MSDVSKLAILFVCLAAIFWLVSARGKSAEVSGGSGFENWQPATSNVSGDRFQRDAPELPVMPDATVGGGIDDFNENPAGNEVAS